MIPVFSSHRLSLFYAWSFCHIWPRAFRYYRWLVHYYLLSSHLSLGNLMPLAPLAVLYLGILTQSSRIGEEEIDTKRGVDLTIFEPLELLGNFRPLWWYVLSDGLVLSLYRLRFARLFTTIGGQPRTLFPLVLNLFLQLSGFNFSQLFFYTLAFGVFIFPFKIYGVRKFNHYYRVPVAFKSPIQAQRFLLGKFRFVGGLTSVSTVYPLIILQELLSFFSGDDEHSCLLAYLIKQIEDVADSRSFVHFRFRRFRRRRRRRGRRNPVWLYRARPRDWRLVRKEQKLHSDFPFHTTTPFATILKSGKRKKV